jgi:hypothetical protein
MIDRQHEHSYQHVLVRLQKSCYSMKVKHASGWGLSIYLSEKQTMGWPGGTHFCEGDVVSNCPHEKTLWPL